MNKRKEIVILTNLVVSVCAIFVLITANLHSQGMLTYSFLLCDFLLILNCISIAVNIKKEKQIRKEAVKIECLEIINQNLKENFDNIRAFRHDFCNIIQSMGGYIKTNDMRGLNEMYNSMIDEVNEIKEIQNLNCDVINNPAVCNLVNNKYRLANNLNIKMDINVLNNINALNIKDFELCRILGILLDNAIEATKDNKERYVSLTFKYDSVNNRDLVVVKNTYSNKNVNIDKIYEKGFTTKKQGNNHGIGLWQVMKIINKHNNLQIYTAKNKCFLQQLEIYR